MHISRMDHIPSIHIIFIFVLFFQIMSITLKYLCYKLKNIDVCASMYYHISWTTTLWTSEIIGNKRVVAQKSVILLSTRLVVGKFW